MLMHNPNTGELIEVVSAVDETILAWAAEIVSVHGDDDLATVLRDLLDRAVDARDALSPEWYALRADAPKDVQEFDPPEGWEQD